MAREKSLYLFRTEVFSSLQLVWFVKAGSSEPGLSRIFIYSSYHVWVFEMVSLSLFYVYMWVSACIDVYRVYAVPEGTRRGHLVPYNWSYRQWWATKWVLGTKPRSSARALGALNCWVISTPQCIYFWGKCLFQVTPFSTIHTAWPPMTSTHLHMVWHPQSHYICSRCLDILWLNSRHHGRSSHKCFRTH